MATKAELQARIDELERQKAEVISILSVTISKPWLPQTRNVHLKEALLTLGCRLKMNMWGWEVVDAKDESA